MGREVAKKTSMKSRSHQEKRLSRLFLFSQILKILDAKEVKRLKED